MANLTLTIPGPSGWTVYGVVMRLSDGHVFDFADDTWKALGSATTPEFSMTAIGTVGGISEYEGTLNLSLINSSATPLDIKAIGIHQAGGSPVPASDTAIGEVDSFAVINGTVLEDGNFTGYRAVGKVTLTTTSGVMAHCKCKLLDATGAVVVDAAATCALEVQRDGVFSQFSVATSDFGAQNANGFFEFDFLNPNFTTDKGYTGIVTIVSGGVTYKSATCDFFVAP